MKTIQEILHADNIIGTIEAVKGQIPATILPSQFFAPTKRIRGNTGDYFKVNNTRKVAQLVMYGSPSKAAKMSGISRVPVVLMHSFEHFDHDPNTVQWLLSPDGGTQELGIAEVGRKTAEFTNLFINLRRAAWYAAMTTGHIYFDGDGNLTVRSSEKVVDIDFGIPATNKGTLNTAATTTVISDGTASSIVNAKWSAAATAVDAQIIALKKFALKQTGYSIKDAYYGSKIPSYLALNTSMKEYLKMHPQSVDVIRAGGVPNGFLDLNWHPAYEAMFQDSKDVTNFFWGDNDVVFTPDVADVGWWGLIEGSYAIPTSIGIVGADAESALRSLRNVSGMFSYATVEHDPATIRQYAGDTFLPVISVPKSIYIATVHW